MGFARNRLAVRGADDPYRFTESVGVFVYTPWVDDASGRARGAMDNLLIPLLAAALILLASMASVEFGVSVALIEICLGVMAGNFLGLSSPPWMDFLASFASILLTFLAGAEVDPLVMREKFKESLLIGAVSTPSSSKPDSRTRRSAS